LARLEGGERRNSKKKEGLKRRKTNDFNKLMTDIPKMNK
jgi:hypothetical protein